MKIIDVIPKAYCASYDRPISNGRYTYEGTEIVICEVATDEGLKGYGWTRGVCGTMNVIIQTLLSLRERVIGEDPFNVERIWEKMYLPKVYGRKGRENFALSALDIALWDIICKAAGRPLVQMAGGYRDAVPGYIAGGYYEKGKGIRELQDEMRGKVRAGASAVKMKIGGASVTQDIERIDAVRDAVGKEVKILVDANNAYTRLEALQMGRELDKRDIYWFEEPLHVDDAEGCAELCRKLNTPIAIGENEYTRWGFKQLIDMHAAQVLNADAQILGGITEWKKVADLAMASHIMMAPHGDQEIHVPLVCAVPNGLIAEYYDNHTNQLLDAMFRDNLHFNSEGMIEAPRRAGIGSDIDFEGLERFQAAHCQNVLPNRIAGQ